MAFSRNPLWRFLLFAAHPSIQGGIGELAPLRGGIGAPPKPHNRGNAPARRCLLFASIARSRRRPAASILIPRFASELAGVRGSTVITGSTGDDFGNGNYRLARSHPHVRDIRLPHTSGGRRDRRSETKETRPISLNRIGASHFVRARRTPCSALSLRRERSGKFRYHVRFGPI